MSSTLPNFHEVSSPEHFQSLLSEDLQRVSLINFWAPWAAPCTEMNKVVLELAKQYPDVLVLQVRIIPIAQAFKVRITVKYSQVNAEVQSDIAESFDIEAVPSFVILRVSVHLPLNSPSNNTSN
jgi:thioredoxin-like negative regulator of GroEL